MRHSVADQTWRRGECVRCRVRVTWAAWPADQSEPVTVFRCPKCNTGLVRCRRRAEPYRPVFACHWHDPMRYWCGPFKRMLRQRAKCAAHDPCSPRRW